MSGQTVPSKALPGPDSALINAEQAVRIAEQFVRENGYTDFVPLDPSKLQPESLEFRDRAAWLAERHDTLKPRAYGYVKGGKDDRDKWVVGFRLTRPLENPNIGRAVTMDEHGKHLKIGHMGTDLRYYTPRPK